MATAPQPPHKPAAPQPHQTPKPSDKKDDKNHEDKHGHTLRDPAEGKPPAVLGEQQGRDTPRQTIGVKGEPIEDGERDPDTVPEEQRRRAAEMERWASRPGRPRTMSGRRSKEASTRTSKALSAESSITAKRTSPWLSMHQATVPATSTPPPT